MNQTQTLQPSGHLPDGSGIQRHSAGDYYPYVVEAKQTPAGLRWGVFGPRMPRETCEHCYGSAREAQISARLLAAEYRRYYR